MFLVIGTSGWLCAEKSIILPYLFTVSKNKWLEVFPTALLLLVDDIAARQNKGGKDASNNVNSNMIGMIRDTAYF